MSAAPSSYRPDVDGLRAIAVLPVVLYHAGLGAFSGGYVGVDVFFVISGFLITSMIHGEVREKRFSIVRFYERRVRRIFPAFFAMVFACCALAWWVLPVADMRAFGESVAASTLFSSNVLFWLQAGYFDDAAHMKPLLHTWSLAVEEQFYIAFPLFLVLIEKIAPRRVALAVVAVLIASFAACVVVTARDAGTAFYIAPLRAWELMIGAALAVGAIPRVTSGLARELMSVAGLAMVLGAVCLFSGDTAFPGFAAAVPCVGAALVIHAGVSDAEARDGFAQPLGARILALAPVVFVGKISYSLYLWHWPLLVFSTFWNVGPEPLDATQTGSIVLAAFCAAVFSWRFIEQPFRARAEGRRSPLLAARASLFAAAAVAMLLATGFGAATAIADGWPSRVGEDARRLDRARHDRSPDRARCHADDKNQIPWEKKCRYGAPAPVAPTLALWGDSFAPELGVELGNVAAPKNVALVFSSYSACPPAIGVEEIARKMPLCAQHNEMMLASLQAAASIRTVILNARYDAYVRPENAAKKFGLGPAYLAGLDRLARALRDAGKRVVVVYPTPEPPAHVPTLLARYAHVGRDVHEPHIDRARFDSQNAATTAVLDKLVADGVAAAARPHEALCDEARCKLMEGDAVLYFDDAHLSLAGARHVMPQLASIWSDP